MYKIYSRKRFRIGRFGISSISGKFNKGTNINQKKKQLKIGKIIAIGIIAFETVNLLLNYVNPIYEKIALESAKSLATIITNEQSTVVMKQHTYNNMFSIEKDNNGNISMIKSNISEINEIISDIASLVQQSMNNAQENQIKIPLGSFSGISLFSGTGPRVKMNVVLMGNVDTELKSEFIAKGINQTLHRVYLQIDCNVKVLSAYKDLNSHISNQVLLIENVIVGQIPSTYYNLEGIQNYEDTLNIID
ncbi:MAG: sporulation protein YunB [Clostridia bacterium]|nr:sporulation protein YunB [Clostridia bacterium]